MKRKQDVNSEANQSFTLPAIVGTWESLNLHPTVMIYQSGKKYLLSMLHVSAVSYTHLDVYKRQTYTENLSVFNSVFINDNKKLNNIAL